MHGRGAFVSGSLASGGSEERQLRAQASIQFTLDMGQVLTGALLFGATVVQLGAHDAQQVQTGAPTSFQVPIRLLTLFVHVAPLEGAVSPLH